MTAKTQKLLDEALQLHPAEREALASQLFDSLELVDPEAEAAWNAEIGKRIADLDNEKVKPSPWYLGRHPPEPDHLIPEVSQFRDGFDVISRYHAKVAQTFLPPHSPVRAERAAVVCLPSFEPEWAVRLTGSEKVPYALILVEAEKGIWWSQEQTVQVRSAKVSLPPDLAGLIADAWGMALREVRHADFQQLGLDGVNYHFTYWDPVVGCIAGRTWSPSNGTVPGRLVTISHLLRDYVKTGKSEQQGITQSIQRELVWFGTRQQ